METLDHKTDPTQLWRPIEAKYDKSTPKAENEAIGFKRYRPTRGGTVRQQTTPANRDHYYPDSLLFVSAGFLPRVSSQWLN